MEDILYLKILKKVLTFEKFHKAISDANLRGLGGAGFPASKKWEFVKSKQGSKNDVLMETKEK